MAHANEIHKTLTEQQMKTLRAAAEPLWRALEEHGWVDAHGGAEFERVFPTAVDFIHASANLGPFQYVTFDVREAVPA